MKNTQASAGRQGESRPDDALWALLDARIRQAGGRLTFAAYMDIVLYAPGLGYYGRPESPIGPAGDYFTAVSATPVFGHILGRLFRRLAHATDAPPDFRIVEVGGHRGRLRDDIRTLWPEVPYRLIEYGDKPPATVSGIVFANELLDALPVHCVRAVAGAWRERYVTMTAPRALAWCDGPLSSPRLADALADLPVALMEGYETEVQLQAHDWIVDIAGRLQPGSHLLLIDYGLERRDYFAPHRAHGTLRCYRRHQCNGDPLQTPGEQDITASVEFTSLIAAGQQAGLELLRFRELGRFLVEEGEDVIRDIAERTAGTMSRERQGLHQLMHPNLMGHAFQVLWMRKPPA